MTTRNSISLLRRASRVWSGFIAARGLPPSGRVPRTIVSPGARPRGLLDPSQLSLLMRSKSGRYMLMTMPPTVTPRNRIMTGSMRVRRLATAWSTSSS